MDNLENKDEAEKYFELAEQVYNEKNYEEAFNLFEKAARQGHAVSQFNLGCMYRDGEGVEQDVEKAFEWYGKAAGQGYAAAQNGLGCMFAKGEGIKQDYTKAFEWYQKAAEQGLDYAQNNLGCMFHDGEGVEQDYEKALHWFKKAAEQGNEDAQYNLGLMYENGEGVKQDYTKAFEWYKEAAEQGHVGALGNILYGIENYRAALVFFEKAAEQGDASAQNRLGNMYECGMGVKQNFETAIEWYKKAAEQGHVGAQYALGNIFDWTEDYTTAFYFFEKAAERGYTDAQCALAEMYVRGEGVEQDYEKAFEWYEKAAEQSDADAQFHLGLMYQLGEGVEKDVEKALEWYTKAAEQGDSDAQFKLGEMYRFGEGVEQDCEKAFEWYKKAAEQRNAYAQYRLGGMYESGEGVEQDYAKAFEWFEKAAEQGNSNAQNNLGSMYQLGKGVEQNYAKAFEWFQKAAEQDAALAQYNLGLIYKSGEGVEQDYAKAFEWFEKAAEQGNPVIQFFFGEMYMKGDGVDQNYEKALEWYGKSAEQGFPVAQYNLGMMYGIGEGVEQDFEKAYEWFKKAAEQGISNAQCILGVLYARGEGVEQDYVKAIEWFQKAAEQGNEDAIKSLELLKNIMHKDELIMDSLENKDAAAKKLYDEKIQSDVSLNTSDNADRTFFIKNVEIVSGNQINNNWQRKMQIIYTDKSDFIDNIPQFGGHDWSQDIGKSVEAIINESTGYYWLKFYKYKEELNSTDAEEELPPNYDINENPELVKIYDYIKQDIPVIFLTGGAGTGKSTFIKFLKNNLRSQLNKTCIVLAPTGVAAINIGGQTIHSFFGFKTDVFENHEIDKLQKNSVIDHTDLIIIDEISMVSSWMLDHIDYALRLWGNPDKPFGGKQMLLIGDCFQLPPIAENNEVKQKYFERWENSFFFAAHVFENVNMKAVQLKKIYRQKDDVAFIHMLNRIRKCQKGYEKDIEFLNENCLIEKRLGTKNVPEECLLLTTKNNDADKFNTLRMNNLQQKGAKTKTFNGEVIGKFNFEHFLTPKLLDLCIGAKIMVTKNISSQELANGDMGKVVDFGSDYVDVEIKGKRCRINKEKWQSLRYSWNDETKSIQQIEEGSFTQIPLKLGWAVTIHKSQGLTLDSVAIQAVDAWDSGQVYVALSRARNLSGILLKEKIPVSAVISNPYIKMIYEKLFPESEMEDFYNEEEYKNVLIDNSKYTIDESKEITSVKIGGIDFELYSSGTIQNHVRNTMAILLNRNLIPQNEMHRLLTDYNYCYAVFGINWKGYKYTLLRKDRNENTVRYWATNYNGYYICSQWYQNLSSNFAKWLIALSRGQLKSNVQSEELLRSNSYYESGVDWKEKRQEEKEKNFSAFLEQRKQMIIEKTSRQATPNFYNKHENSNMKNNNSFLEKYTPNIINSNLNKKIEESIQKSKILSSFVVIRSPLLQDGLLQFIKNRWFTLVCK